MDHLVSPSLLAADFANLEHEVTMINRSEADWVHLDIMDGVIVPNISFGFPVIKAVKKAKISRATFKPLRAGKNRFPQPRNPSVRAISLSVRAIFDPCGHFPVRADEIQYVRDISRFVRANFPSVREKINPCGHFSLCAGKKPRFL